jgi:hypothetical protein
MTWLLSRRPDGRLARDVPAYRRMMPFVMTSKATAMAASRITVDMEAALDMVARPPAGLEGVLTLTHLFLRAIALTLHEHPELNRFVASGRIYQRDGIWLSFSAKKAFDVHAPIVTIKERFDPAESLPEMARRLRDRLAEGRSEKKSFVDKETAFLLRLPPAAIRAVVRLQAALDHLGLLPAEMIERDIFYASAFVANLGSIGLDAVYHHLYEYGNIPLFMCIGRVAPTPTWHEDGTCTVRRAAEIKVTMDERITDGFYAARALKRFKHLLEHPADL